MKDVTFCLATILRDDSLYECVESIRDSYPEASVIVADDGHHTAAKDKKMNALAIDYLKLPFDVGLSRKRNWMVHAVRTPYTAIVDDDMVITKDARVDELVALLDVADLAAGKIRYDSGRTHDYLARLHFAQRPKGKALLMRPLRSPWVEGELRWRRTHLALNCFVAWTPMLRAIGWDNRFKTTYEHLDFFLRARLAGRYIVHAPDAIFDERRVRNEEYLKFRGRHEEARAIFFRKWALHDIDKDVTLMTGAERRAAGL